MFVEGRGEQDSKIARGISASLGTVCTLCGAWRGAYGLEPTIDLYVQHTVEILREIRRVLRKDGVCFWNVGDSYASNRGNYTRPRKGSSAKVGQEHSDLLGAAPNRFLKDGLKDKDLCLMPFRVALAAQADGWWVRSDIIWHKPNPMPESVTDRPTDAYEHILMLTKSQKYFWDAAAVAEPLKRPDEGSRKTPARFGGADKFAAIKDQSRLHSGNEYLGTPNGTRNIRNVWTFATQPYKGAHFATFPEELPRRCILAASSEKGACAKCGAPWMRNVKKTLIPERDMIADANDQASNRVKDGHKPGWVNVRETLGWSPTCKCNCPETVPCTVLDPFGGSGTTGKVAVELQRNAVLCDVAYGTGGYRELAEQRIAQAGTRKSVPVHKADAGQLFFEAA